MGVGTEKSYGSEKRFVNERKGSLILVSFAYVKPVTIKTSIHLFIFSSLS